MWQPEPGWTRLPGSGPSTVGLWRATDRGRDVVVKRLAAPGPHDPEVMGRPDHPAWWRRAVDVALDGCVEKTAGLRARPVLRVDEDAEGITLVHEFVPDAGNPGLFLAHALGRFAGESLPDAPWLARDQLRTRLGHIEQRGGWRLLARTSMADLATVLWQRRESFLAQLDTLPHVPQHGDPTRGNLWGRDGVDVVAIDWSTLGTGPVGGDLGYFALSSPEQFEPLLEAYLSGLPTGVASRAQATTGARITAVYSALTRADWALARAAGADGVLAGKLRHPSVAPHLLALQRQFAQLEALVG